ncbi:FecR family protein [Chondrinema litorale]|uniref:FecR family protein n=1 Tax=Chondrinema litorale TaxID=2994555 RepID=UPI0025432990|nr:FecR family protein [Chondrinema litorale]UZR96526.1 FecR family protein [Chondrinema litorale]
MEQQFYIAELISKRIRNSISQKEETELQNWINESTENAELFQKIISNEQLLSKLEIYQLFDQQKSWELMEEKLFKTKTVQLQSQKYWRYAAAILLPLFLAVGVMYFYLNSTEEDALSRIDKVVKPGSQKATLILEDGTDVDLQGETPQENIKQRATEIINYNNVLTYSIDTSLQDSSATPKSKIELVFNQLITPVGGGYQLTLADGTEVWLNAASSLKYPIAFTDSTREVFLEGEGYFKVAHNGKPFIVNGNSVNIGVLGTTFNVSNYEEEPLATATLVEGSIQLNTSKKQKILQPNDHAVFTKKNSDLVVNQVNTSVYTSWVDGKIEFANEDLETVMRKLARWYNFEYSFENEQAKQFHFTGRINNTAQISSILKMLEMTTKVKFELEEETIVIL